MWIRAHVVKEPIQRESLWAGCPLPRENKGGTGRRLLEQSASWWAQGCPGVWGLGLRASPGARAAQQHTAGFKASEAPARLDVRGTDRRTHSFPASLRAAETAGS